MKKIDYSAVTSTIAMPHKSGTFLHLQSAYQEGLSALGQCLAGSSYDPTKVYILHGLVNSGSGSNYNISSGSVFYGGEVYLVDAASFTISNPNVAVGIITTTFFAASDADPVEFDDGVLRNVHQIRKIKIQSGLSGSGAGNFLDFIDVTKRLQGALGEIKIWNWKFYGGAFTDYFNTATGLGIHPYTLGWAICDGQNLTDNMGGLMPVGYASGDPDFNTPFTDTGGEKTHVLLETELPPHQHPIPATSTGAPGTNAVNFNGNQNTTVATGSTGGGQAHNNMPPYRAVLFVQRIA